MWLSGIIGLITNGVGPLFTWLTSRDNAKRDEALAQINAWLASLQTITQFKAVQFGWWGTRLLFFCISAAVIYYTGEMYLDQCRWILWLEHRPGSWGLTAPPEPFQSMIQPIILSFFATTVTGGVLKAVNNHLQLHHERELIRSNHAEFLPRMAATQQLTAARTRVAATPDGHDTSTPPIIYLIAFIVGAALLVWLGFIVARYL